MEKNNEIQKLISPFKTEPSMNIISKEVFEDRVRKVFHLLWDALKKSFGPYGAPTLILNYPFSHVTKDGFTIMKNISMNTAETLLDQAIADMASDICGRLNFTSGDGTTSAIIATNSIFENYMKMRTDLENMYLLPRDIIRSFNDLKEKIIDKLMKKVVSIQSTDPEVLEKNIRDVVYISSNGDEIMTDYISKLYRDLGCPAINCTSSVDGVSRATIVKGYKYNLSLTDRLYINSENNTMDLKDSDLIIFSKRVTSATYNEILKPLNNQVMARGRHLIVCAPTYDEVALNQIISKDLTAEHKKKKDINMVLCNYKANSFHARKLLQDFAILMDATVIDNDTESKIFDDIKRGKPIYEIFNIDNRGIEGINRVAFTEKSAYIIKAGEETRPMDLPEGETTLNFITNNDSDIRLGFSSDCSIGLNDSVFRGQMYYNEGLYEATLKDAKMDLEEKEKKYQKLGTFNLEVSEAQERLYSLQLKMGLIEVGGDSELSQKLLKDSVDDAIKAAASAYNHGVVLGCNVDLINAINEVYEETKSETDKALLNILYNGFVDVYRTVLDNASLCRKVDVLKDPYESMKEFMKKIFNKDIEIPDDESIKLDESYISSELVDDKYALAGNLDDFIIKVSTKTNTVFDVTNQTFVKNIVNSVETDSNILKATIDLIALLITGNQMIITQKHNF